MVVKRQLPSVALIAQLIADAQPPKYHTQELASVVVRILENFLSRAPPGFILVSFLIFLFLRRLLLLWLNHPAPFPRAQGSD